VAAISEAVAVLDVVACPSAPVAHLAIVLAPCMSSPVANGDLGLTTSLAFEVRGLVHVVVDAAANVGYGVSGGETVRALVHCQSFSLKGFLQGPDALGDLASLRVVCAKVLDFACQHDVVLSLQGPVYQVSELHSLG